MAQAQLWLKTLRQAVKGDYGPGWILKEQYDRFKIGRAEAGNARHGKTQFVSTDLPFARGSHRKVLNLIGEMVAKMQDPELNVGLAEAYELVRGSTEVTQDCSGAAAQGTARRRGAAGAALSLRPGEAA